MANNANPSLMPEIGPDGLPRESPVIAYTEKFIEQEKLQLKKYIEENYSKIRDVEREFANLNLELNLTTGSKNAVLFDISAITQNSTSSSIPTASTPEVNGVAWNALSQCKEDYVPTIKGENQLPLVDGEGRGKKKNVLHGRGKGIGALPKGRGPPGWTGAGFDVDSKS